MASAKPTMSSEGVTHWQGVPSVKPRLKAIDRQQMVLRPVEVDRLVEEDHAVRVIWELISQRDLEEFYAPIKAVEGVAGREATDPHLLVCLWIFAYSEGVSSAREIERLCEYHPAYQWLTGFAVINHHTLSDFRMLPEHRQGPFDFARGGVGRCDPF